MTLIKKVEIVENKLKEDKKFVKSVVSFNAYTLYIQKVIRANSLLKKMYICGRKFNVSSDVSARVKIIVSSSFLS